MYLMAQSCLHVVINFPRPPKPDQNTLYLYLFHPPLQNSVETQKFRRNRRIPWLSSKFRVSLKTVVHSHTATDTVVKADVYSTPTDMLSVIATHAITSQSSLKLLQINIHT